MPNWTDVRVAITHDDATKIKELHEIFSNESPFQRIKPMPEHIYRGDLSYDDREKYGKDNWYDWSIDNWGTKWDIDEAYPQLEDDNTLFVMLQTAWAPPTGVFDELVAQGFNVHAQYLDEGWCYIGEYIDGSDETWSEIDQAPEHLREEFDIALDEMNEH